MSILSLVVFIVVDDVVIGGGAESDDGVGVGGVGGDGVSIGGICGGSVIGTTGEGCGGSIGFPGTGELTSTAMRTIHLCFCSFVAC